MKLASVIFDKQDGISVIKYIHLRDKAPMRVEFFNPAPEKQLRAVVELSKIDPSVVTTAANAIIILVKVGVGFNGANLRDVPIPETNLSDGEFDCGQFLGADMIEINLTRSCLRQKDFNNAQMKDVRFGELLYLKEVNYITSCTYSPDGKILAAGLDNGGLNGYDTFTWKVIERHRKHQRRFLTVALSPEGKQLVTEA
ncbi:hypothetical protein BGZ47_000743, partial [Haplosporangium gracile]